MSLANPSLPFRTNDRHCALGGDIALSPATPESSQEPFNRSSLLFGVFYEPRRRDIITGDRNMKIKKNYRSNGKLIVARIALQCALKDLGISKRIKEASGRRG